MQLCVLLSCQSGLSQQGGGGYQLRADHAKLLPVKSLKIDGSRILTEGTDFMTSSGGACQNYEFFLLGIYFGNFEYNRNYRLPSSWIERYLFTLIPLLVSDANIIVPCSSRFIGTLSLAVYNRKS